MSPELLPHISENGRRWLRFGLLVGGLIVLVAILYALRAVFTPILIAAAIAYVVNPLITWVVRTRRIPRLYVVITAFVLLGVLVVGGGFYGGSRTIAQLAQFQDQIGHYARLLVASIATPDGDPAEAATQPATSPAAQWQAYLVPLVQEHGSAVATSVLRNVLGFFSNVFNLLSLLILVPVFTFVFLLHFNEIITTLRDHLPAAQRDHVVHIVSTIDRAIASFFRGRLIVCLVVAVLTGLGWTLVGVPYSLLLGALAGTLNLVPFLSLLALPPALFFAYVAAVDAGASWPVMVTLTMGVYMVVQAIESFALSPLVEGRSSGLHPLVIIVAIMIGAQAAGLLGMLLAIPVASTLKVFAAQWILPEIRRRAEVTTPERNEDATP